MEHVHNPCFECKHVFHYQCVRNHIKYQLNSNVTPSCPLCRTGCKYMLYAYIHNTDRTKQISIHITKTIILAPKDTIGQPELDKFIAMFGKENVIKKNKILTEIHFDSSKYNKAEFYAPLMECIKLVFNDENITMSVSCYLRRLKLAKTKLTANSDNFKDAFDFCTLFAIFTQKNIQAPLLRLKQRCIDNNNTCLFTTHASPNVKIVDICNSFL